MSQWREEAVLVFCHLPFFPILSPIISPNWRDRIWWASSQKIKIKKLMGLRENT